jgi:hypothetical protein
MRSPTGHIPCPQHTLISWILEDYIIILLLASYCDGGLTNIIDIRSVRKNEGIFEPVYKLVALFYYRFFLLPIGLLMYISSTFRWVILTTRYRSWSPTSNLMGSTIRFYVFGPPSVMTCGRIMNPNVI